MLRGLGLQTSSTSSTYLSLTTSTRFIPTAQVQDIFIHEAFKGFEVRFYVVVVVEGEDEVVVVFPVRFSFGFLGGLDWCGLVWSGLVWFSLVWSGLCFLWGLYFTVWCKRVFTRCHFTSWLMSTRRLATWMTLPCLVPDG